MIRALHTPDKEQFVAKKHPGSFRLEGRATEGQFEFVYYCPCGCGILGRLLVGEGHKPEGSRPSWQWNGSTTDPTLAPSVNHVDHWHGWLRDGYWESV